MRPVNLIPVEDRKHRRGGGNGSSPVGYIVIGVLLAVLAGVVALVSTGNTIVEREAEIDRLEGEKQVAQARADSLRSFADFASTEEARTATVTSLATSRFDWERVLRELALVIPPNVTLLTVSGTASPEVSVTNEVDIQLRGEIPGPALSLNGCAVSQPGVAELVAAVEDIDGVTRVGLSDSVVEDAQVDTSRSCPGGIRFTMVAAFDEFTSLPASTPPPAAAVPASDDGGVDAAEAERAQAAESVEDSAERTDRVVEQTMGG